MKNLLISPSKMSLSTNESIVYQNALKQAGLLSLNLLAVKVTNHPKDFNGWCRELIDVCRHRINRDLLDEEQHKPLKKLTELLIGGISISQLRMAKIAPWSFYADFLTKQAQVHALDERRLLLDYVATLTSNDLAGMIDEDRRVIAGKHTATHDPLVFNFDCEWFGSTKTNKAFHTILDNSPEAFDMALAHIPLTGEVNHSHYQAFINDFCQAFTAIDAKATLGPASRLLAMRRPDQFVAVTTTKLDHLCQGLGIKRLTTTNFAGYWSELIGTVRAMGWWDSAAPEAEDELFLWKNRAILLDILLYGDETTPEKSNYLKLLKKPSRAKSTGNSKRSKESAAALVDRVLSTEEMPDFIVAQRDSIVAQVESGKKIDDVISLLRKIFG
ncbi:MAG: hypothetical protein HRU23_16150 [Gammaproteobacteria bacterium]|nr:hypothetical protein [Gammaproteobacteria bacterium]